MENGKSARRCRERWRGVFFFYQEQSFSFVRSFILCRWIEEGEEESWFALLWLDYSGSTSSSLVDPSWNSPSSVTSSIQPTDDDNLSDTDSCQQRKFFPSLTNGHTHHSMTNGYIQYNKSGKSRSCENSLDSCGRKPTEDLTSSSSSLIDLPISSSTTTATTSTTDYDNLPLNNGNHEMNVPLTNPTRHLSNSPQSPISSELDQKTKDAIDARLKEIDDELDLNGKREIERDRTASLPSSGLVL